MGICCTNTHACVCLSMCVFVLLTSQMTPEKGLNLIKVFCLFTVDNSRVELPRPTRYSVIVCTTRRGVGWRRSLSVCECVCVMEYAWTWRCQIAAREKWEEGVGSGGVAADATSVCTSLSSSWLLIFALSIRSRFSQVTIYHRPPLSLAHILKAPTWQHL